MSATVIEAEIRATVNRLIEKGATKHMVSMKLKEIANEVIYT